MINKLETISKQVKEWSMNLPIKYILASIIGVIIGTTIFFLSKPSWNWMEIINNISIFIAIWVAIYGIEAWRREHIGKRQLELAEDTLALFYEAANAIRHIRHIMGDASETADLVRDDRETDEQFNARKRASVVYYRINQHQELFNKIYASRYRFMAQIGKDEASPFDDLKKILDEIALSAYMLSGLWSKKRFRDKKSEQKHYESITNYEAIFWGWGADDDPIDPKIDKVIIDIEKTCRSVIVGKGTLHGLFSR